MPRVEVVYYQNDDETVPMKEWMKGLGSQPKHRAKCIEWIGLLRDNGHDLRRPIADYLRDDIHELRPRFQRIQYRMLYFFYGRERAVITHGIIKQTDKVPPKEIDRAVEMKKRYEQDADRHSHWEVDYE
ncbi:MAG: type II toxin-antitoxin system RelE/ParE family toxin [Thermodesulfobacteriota bacterium]